VFRAYVGKHLRRWMGHDDLLKSAMLHTQTLASEWVIACKSSKSKIGVDSAA
jgi:hypothetical protein